MCVQHNCSGKAVLAAAAMCTHLRLHLWLFLWTLHHAKMLLSVNADTAASRVEAGRVRLVIDATLSEQTELHQPELAPHGLQQQLAYAASKECYCCIAAEKPALPVFLIESTRGRSEVASIGRFWWQGRWCTLNIKQDIQLTCSKHT